MSGFDTISVIGLGLLGGSVAAAARERGLARQVVGVSRRAENTALALERGVVDSATTHVPTGVGEADLVVLATPVYAMERTLQGAAPHLKAGALVTDVGSVKGPLVDSLPCQLPPGVRFVGSHPMAGSHATGLEHARADLFEGAVCVVTPGSEPADAERLAEFWKALGMRVELRGPERHDEEVAWVSHLPHALAFAFARALEAAPASSEILRASGFRDFTRVARSDPEMWADILVTNRKALAAPIQETAERLTELARSIEAGDQEAVSAFLSAGRELLAESGIQARGPKTDSADLSTEGDSVPEGDVEGGNGRSVSAEQLSTQREPIVEGGGARSGGEHPEIQTAKLAVTKE